MLKSSGAILHPALSQPMQTWKEVELQQAWNQNNANLCWTSTVISPDGLLKNRAKLNLSKQANMFTSAVKIDFISNLLKMKKTVVFCSWSSLHLQHLRLSLCLIYSMLIHLLVINLSHLHRFCAFCFILLGFHFSGFFFFHGWSVSLVIGEVLRCRHSVWILPLLLPCVRFFKRCLTQTEQTLSLNPGEDVLGRIVKKNPFWLRQSQSVSLGLSGRLCLQLLQGTVTGVECRLLHSNF